MRTAKQIIENIEDRMVYINKEIKQYDKKNYTETYFTQLQAISSELDDLLSWIKE